jgi:integrase
MPEFEDDYTPRERRLTLAEVGRLLESLMVRDNAQAEELASNRAMCVAFIVATGARWAEVMRAELGDIDFGAGLVRLRGSKTKRATRDVPMTRLTRDAIALVALEAERWDWRRGRLFRGWSNVIRDLAVACRQAGVPRATPNDLRRTFGSWLRAAGAPLDAIAMAMGHADSRMVERVYGRINTAELSRLLSVGLMAETSENQGPVRGLLKKGDGGDDR